MTSNRERQQRAAARARLEREMTLRAEAAQRRRRIQSSIGAGLAVLVVLVGVILVVTLTGNDKKKNTAAAPAASASATPTNCHWNSTTQAGQPANPNAKDVGTPPATGEPRSGTQTMTVTTNLGTIKIAVDDAKAPCTAASFTYLASKKFFDNSPCHRLTTTGLYVLQCGDPTGTGSGGPTYQFNSENLPTDKRPAYPEGAVAMANSGQPGTNGSQFFIIYKDTDLPPDYTVLGKVTEGLDIVKQVAAAGTDGAYDPSPGGGHPKKPITITSLTMSDPSQS